MRVCQPGGVWLRAGWSFRGRAWRGFNLALVSDPPSLWSDERGRLRVTNHMPGVRR